MTRIRSDIGAVVYLPITYEGPQGIVYGHNLFPGEQSIEDSAWESMQRDGASLRYVQDGLISLVPGEVGALVRPVEELQETLPPVVLDEVPEAGTIVTPKGERK